MAAWHLKRIQILLCSIFLGLLCPKIAHAEEIAAEKEPMDIVFVIDCSGSMVTNDPQKMGLDMVQAFVDTVPSENIRIGYVAYNDEILSFSALEPMETAEKRESLKEEIREIAYSGYTDIGLGISQAYGLFPTEKNARQIMVLISDGETALPEGGERTEEQSGAELEEYVSQCRDKNIQIYTVAFGEFDGSRTVLEETATSTGAESYSAQGPEDLIEVLYGIFQDSLVYKIQQFSSGRYADGSQEIKCVLDAPHIDEINILLLSSEAVGETTVRYRNGETPLAGTSHYAVGKIEDTGEDPASKELVVRSETGQGQDLQVYIISYRKMTPILQVAASAGRNQELEYQVYFKDPNGSVVCDEGFYENFVWELACTDAGVAQESARASDGVLKGMLRFSQSGKYVLEGTLTDEFGSFSFPAQIEVENAIPEGSMPVDSCTILDKEWTLCLDEYFSDQNKDALAFSVVDVQDGVEVQLEKNLLTIAPKSTGRHAVTIQVSDGEDAVQYVHYVTVVPLWKVYWWIPMLAAMAAVLLLLLLWKAFRRPKPELERLTEEKKKYHFSGRMDAYFVLQPEDEEEIPALSFQMNKVKDVRISLGSLFGAYAKQAGALHLEDIFLIADENRSMILYHKSKSSIMIGNAIACAQMQYSISFGDIIYVTSPEGDYDLEIHYVAVFK